MCVIYCSIRRLYLIYWMQLDLDDFNIENTYFKNFDRIVRARLDSVWHKVSPKTKQLVRDLDTLRKLLDLLLTADPIDLLEYIENIIGSYSKKADDPNPLQYLERPAWLESDHGATLIAVSKARCFKVQPKQPQHKGLAPTGENTLSASKVDKNAHADDQPWWLPRGMIPVWEEPGKWGVLAEILLEIEQEIISKPLRFCENISASICRLLIFFHFGSGTWK